MLVIWVDVSEGTFVECFVLGKEMVGREWVLHTSSGGLVWVQVLIVGGDKLLCGSDFAWLTHLDSVC